MNDLAERLLGSDAKTRARTTQVLATVPVYVAGALGLYLASRQGWTTEPQLVGWVLYSGAILALVYAAVRSGWSTRFEDSSLVTLQSALGIIAAIWAYGIAGPSRAAAIYPLLLIFTFSASTLRTSRVVALTVFALVGLSACIVVLELVRPERAGPGVGEALGIDLINWAMLLVLLPAISLVAFRVSSLRTRLRAEKAEVLRLATHDELTGLPNRRRMIECLAQEHSRFERSGRSYSVALVDLDHFKRINDVAGHAQGDEVLRLFAKECISTLRTSDLAARWGGEEFLLLLPEAEVVEATRALERLLTRFRAVPFREDLSLSFSAGVVQARREESPESLVARADSAMYKAKQAGRGRIAAD